MVGISRIVVFDYIQPAARPTVIYIIITIVHQTNNMHMETISEMFVKGEICYFKHIFFISTHISYTSVVN